MPDLQTADHDQTKQQLALVQALSGEISSAISALERNDMVELGSHVAAQEVICQKMKQQDPQRLRKAAEAYGSTAQIAGKSSSLQKLRDEYLALAHLNRIYARMISRSQKSIELLSNLYQNYGQRYNKDEKTRPGKHTWSCEV
jgi:hypothetical protein